MHRYLPLLSYSFFKARGCINLYHYLAIPSADPPTYTVEERFTPTEGTPFRVDLGLDANPIPGTGMFEWFFNGQPLGPGVVTGVDFIDFGNSISRDASGNYTVSSFNEAGSGNASFVIDVLCKPIPFCILNNHSFDFSL